MKCLTIPEKLAVMRMCVWGIDVASFCNFIIGFRNVCIFQPGLFSIPQGFICPFHLTFNNSYSFIYPSTFWHKMSHIFGIINRTTIRSRPRWPVLCIFIGNLLVFFDLYYPINLVTTFSWPPTRDTRNYQLLVICHARSN